MTSFICDGLGPGHKVLCFSAAPAIEVETARLARMNAEIGAALGDGRLDVLAAHDVYLPDGCFEADRMVAFVGDAHGHALRDGFAGLSVNGDMRWALSGGPGCDRLPEYEQRLNAVCEDDTLLMLCCYDVARFAVGSRRRSRLRTRSTCHRSS